MTTAIPGPEADAWQWRGRARDSRLLKQCAGPKAVFGEAYFGSCSKKQRYIQNAAGRCLAESVVGHGLPISLYDMSYIHMSQL